MSSLAVTLTPAYGRDYKSKNLAIKDFDAGKDFIVNGFGPGAYASKEDLIQKGVKLVKIRFNKLTKVELVYLF
jgi:hypothetical protein